MSRPRLALSVAFACVLTGCGTAEPSDTVADGEISFLLNGEPWQPTDPPLVARSPYGYQVIASYWVDGRFPLHQRILFSVPEAEWAGVRRYPLDFGVDRDGSPRKSSFIEANGDEIVTRYEPLPGGAFEVTRYDEATSEIEGRFEGVFVIAPDHTDATYRLLADTLRVTEGRFRGVLDDLR